MTEPPMRAPGGLAIAWYPHHVEHLAPWCEIMGVPMLLADSPGLFAATRCYPGLDVAWAHGVRMPAGRDPFARAIRERRPGVVYCSDLFDRSVLRFSELERAIPGVSQKMLIQQLRELERDGVVERTVYPQVPPKVEYRLTPWGQAMCPALDALLKWAAARPAALNRTK